jgi:molybdopterin-biosynthesis enzyme MoeA-like protein
VVWRRRIKRKVEQPIGGTGLDNEPRALSGLTKDKNIGYVAGYLTTVGIDLKEVRVVGDEERAIIEALNALRHRYSYVFTTGGIGPTHGDITADCMAKAFGVTINTDPRALAILHEWVETTGTEMNEARLRLTRIPKGADLILNKVSGAPGFWIGNVIVMAGVPSIMQAMLDEVAPSSRSAFACSRKPCARMRARGTSEYNLARLPKPIPGSRSRAIRSSTHSTAPTRMWCCAPAMHRRSHRPNVRSRRCWSECGGHNQVVEARPLTAKTGVRVP